LVLRPCFCTPYEKEIVLSSFLSIILDDIPLYRPS
jgi:hypothetical protein